MRADACAVCSSAPGSPRAGAGGSGKFRFASPRGRLRAKAEADGEIFVPQVRRQRKPPRRRAPSAPGRPAEARAPGGASAGPLAPPSRRAQRCPGRGLRPGKTQAAQATRQRLVPRQRRGLDSPPARRRQRKPAGRAPPHQLPRTLLRPGRGRADGPRAAGRPVTREDSGQEVFGEAAGQGRPSPSPC